MSEAMTVLLSKKRHYITLSFVIFLFVVFQVEPKGSVLRGASSNDSSFVDGLAVKLPCLAKPPGSFISMDEECRQSFTSAPIQSLLEPPVELEGSGRSGNLILSLIHLVHYAETHCCNLLFPPEVLPGFPSMAFRNLADCAVHANSTLPPNVSCKKLRIDDVLRFEGTCPKCATFLLRELLQVNSTHSLGQRCVETEHAALHVRAGDVVAGDFHVSSGAYTPSVKVHNMYWLYPTSYYVSVYRNIRKESSSRNIFVFCETLDNPTCGFFGKLADIDEQLHVRTGHPLTDDITLMLCARDVAISRGTFHTLFTLSLHMKSKHGFVIDRGEGSHLSLSEIGNPENIPAFQAQHGQQSLESEILYYFADENERQLYKSGTVPWKNTAYQRFLVDKRHRIDWQVKNVSAWVRG